MEIEPMVCFFNRQLAGFEEWWSNGSGGFQPTIARYLTIYKAGWFGTCVIFPYIGNFIIPTDLHILQRGRYATNQKAFVLGRCKELSPQNRMCST